MPLISPVTGLTGSKMKVLRLGQLPAKQNALSVPSSLLNNRELGKVTVPDTNPSQQNAADQNSTITFIFLKRKTKENLIGLNKLLYSFCTALINL